MSEPAAWVYDLVIELMDQEEVHPKLFFTSGAFEGYAQYDWCACLALKHVPKEVLDRAHAIRTYKHATEAG